MDPEVTYVDLTIDHEPPPPPPPLRRLGRTSRALRERHHRLPGWQHPNRAANYPHLAQRMSGEHPPPARKVKKRKKVSTTKKIKKISPEKLKKLKSMR